MESYNKFWSEEKKQVAERCEDKGARLFYDNLQEMYFVVKKFPDDSVLHTKETELFNSREIKEVNDFIKEFQPAPVKKWDVISPDGFSIHFSDVYDTKEQAQEAFNKWKENYTAQGYYSSSQYGRILLNELENHCRYIEIDEDETID